MFSGNLSLQFPQLILVLKALNPLVVGFDPRVDGVEMMTVGGVGVEGDADCRPQNDVLYVIGLERLYGVCLKFRSRQRRLPQIVHVDRTMQCEREIHVNAECLKEEITGLGPFGDRSELFGVLLPKCDFARREGCDVGVDRAIQLYLSYGGENGSRP